MRPIDGEKIRNDIAYWQDEHVAELSDHLLSHGVTTREQGEWIVKDSSEESTLCECSKCHVWLTFYEGCYSPNSCPYCGAPMKGKANEH